MSWWNSEVWKSLAAGLQCFVSHFGQYGLSWMTYMNVLYYLTIVIPRLLCVFRIANAASSTIELVISVTSNYVNSFNFVMWAFSLQCFHIELVPYSVGSRRTWWQMILMIWGLPVSSIWQCNSNLHQDACLESFQAIGHFELTFIEAHQAFKMIGKVRSLKSRLNTHALLEDIITSSNEVFNDFESDIVVGIRKISNLTCETAESNLIVTQNAGS